MDSNFSQGRKAVQALIWAIVSFVFSLGATTGCHLMTLEVYLADSYPFVEVSQ